MEQNVWIDRLFRMELKEGGREKKKGNVEREGGK